MAGLNQDWQKADQSSGYYNQEKKDIMFDSNGEPFTDESILENPEYTRLQEQPDSEQLRKLDY